MKIQRGNPIKLAVGKQAEISHQFRNKTENENIGKILKEKSFEDILYFFLYRVTEMSSKKSLKRIAIETGIVVLLGFATGWTIVKTILDTTNPDDLIIIYIVR